MKVSGCNKIFSLPGVWIHLQGDCALRIVSLCSFKKCEASSFQAHLLVFYIFQVMKRTRTFSETFPTWPLITQRSSDAAAQTPNLNRPPVIMSSSTFFYSPQPQHTLFFFSFKLKCSKERALRHADTSILSGYLPHVELSWCWLQKGRTDAPNRERFVWLHQRRTIASKWKHWRSFMSPAWGVLCPTLPRVPN